MHWVSGTMHTSSLTWISPNSPNLISEIPKFQATILNIYSIREISGWGGGVKFTKQQDFVSSNCNSSGFFLFLSLHLLFFCLSAGKWPISWMQYPNHPKKQVNHLPEFRYISKPIENTWYIYPCYRIWYYDHSLLLLASKSVSSSWWHDTMQTVP